MISQAPDDESADTSIVRLPFPEFTNRRAVIDELCNFLYFDHFNCLKLSVEDIFYLYCMATNHLVLHLRFEAVADFLLLARLKSLCEVELAG